jgi:antitoxin CptB
MDELRRVRLEKMRWHCRRALLELDLVFQRFWGEVGDNLDDATIGTMEGLLELEDHDLWELVSGRRRSEDPRAQAVLDRLQAIRLN